MVDPRLRRNTLRSIKEFRSLERDFLPIQNLLASRRRRLVVGLTVAVLLLGLLVWQIAERVTRSTGFGASPTSSLAVISHVQPRQSVNFSLLRTPPEGLSAWTKRILRKPTFGMNWALAHRLPVAVPGDFWAIPGNGFLCIVAQPDIHTTTRSCATTDDALAHGVAAVLIRAAPTSGNTPDNRLIVGVAPDRARNALVQTAGWVTTVPVLDNVFMLRDSATDPPDSMTLR